jgi:hypothetical protein
MITRAEAMASSLARFWTPDLVADRLEDGLRITVATAGRVGPRRHGNGMPTVLHEFSDAVHWGERRYAEIIADRRAEIERSAARRGLSADVVSRADAACAWPTRFLSDLLDRDAVWLVILGRVSKRSIEGMLKRRRAVADAMIERRAPGSAAVPDIVRIYEDEAQAAAEKIAAWANAALAAPLRPELVPQGRKGQKPTPAQIRSAQARRDQGVRASAHIRFRREIAAAGTVERIAAPRPPVTRGDVMPGRNFNVEPLYRRFNAALRTICAALNDDPGQGR